MNCLEDSQSGEDAFISTKINGCIKFLDEESAATETSSGSSRKKKKRKKNKKDDHRFSHESMMLLVAPKIKKSKKRSRNAYSIEHPLDIKQLTIDDDELKLESKTFHPLSMTIRMALPINGFKSVESETFQELASHTKVMRSWKLDKEPLLSTPPASEPSVRMPKRRMSTTSRAGSVRSTTSTVYLRHRNSVQQEVDEEMMLRINEVTNAMQHCSMTEPKKRKLKDANHVLSDSPSERSKKRKRRRNATGFPPNRKPKRIKYEEESTDVSREPKINKKREKIAKTLQKKDELSGLTARQLQLKQIKEIQEAEIAKKTLEMEQMTPPEKITKLRKKREIEQPIVEHPVECIPEHQHPKPKIIQRRKSIAIPGVQAEHHVRMIAKNIFNGDTQKRAYKASLVGSKCNCTEGKCGESCLNKSVFIECDASVCGTECSNTTIQKGRLLGKKMEKFQTEQKGFGIRTQCDIVKKSLIMEYTGEVCYLDTFRGRMQTIYKDDHHHYCLELSGGLVIDAHRMGSLCRFVNHSCHPNCQMQKIYVEGLPRMVLQASEDIKAGTELTYDYRFDNFEDVTPQECFCGAENCRGTLSAQVKPPRKSNEHPKESTKERPRRKHHRKTRARRTSPRPVCNPYLPRNIRQIQMKSPELYQYYRNNLEQHLNEIDDDFLYIAKIERRLETPVPEIKKVQFSEESQMFNNILDQLEASYSEQLAKIKIPEKHDNVPSNHDRISYPVTFSSIRESIQRTEFDLNPISFHQHMCTMMDNVTKFYGINCLEFDSMMIVKNAYRFICQKLEDKFRLLWINDYVLNVIMERTVKATTKGRKNRKNSSDEDVIECHCRRYLDEGLMVQCSKCETWQHSDCIGTVGMADDYLCWKCANRQINMEILRTGENFEGNPAYWTLLRDNLQIRLGDAIYVLRQSLIDPSDPAKGHHTYKTIGDIDYSNCDIVRVDDLYRDNEGRAFVWGHLYLRPSETFHEPSRKFYSNELILGSLFEKIPIDLVAGICWVLDPATYSKGRPIDCIEQHVYVCEFKVCKQARVFTVVKKGSRAPINTKSFAFHRFYEPLKQRRNHLPHEIDATMMKKLKVEPKRSFQINNEQTNKKIKHLEVVVKKLTTLKPSTFQDNFLNKVKTDVVKRSTKKTLPKIEKMKNSKSKIFQPELIQQLKSDDQELDLDLAIPAIKLHK